MKTLTKEETKTAKTLRRRLDGKTVYQKCIILNESPTTYLVEFEDGTRAVRVKAEVIL